LECGRPRAHTTDGPSPSQAHVASAVPSTNHLELLVSPRRRAQVAKAHELRSQGGRFPCLRQGGGGRPREERTVVRAAAQFVHALGARAVAGLAGRAGGGGGRARCESVGGERAAGVHRVCGGAAAHVVGG